MGIFCLLSEFFGLKAEFEYWEKYVYCKAWACTLSRINMNKTENRCQDASSEYMLLQTQIPHSPNTLNAAAAGSVDIP